MQRFRRRSKNSYCGLLTPRSRFHLATQRQNRQLLRNAVIGFGTRNFDVMIDVSKVTVVMRVCAKQSVCQ
jgi:hypothetical protein